MSWGVRESQFCHSAKFDLDDDRMEPSKRSSVDAQNCSRLDKNPLIASRVGLTSFNDAEDESKTNLTRRW